MATRTRTQVGLALLLAVLAYAVVLATVLGGVVLPTFERLEREDAQRNIDRVAQAIRREIGFVADLARDWAHWDDSYAFAQQPNSEFYQSNLSEEAIAETPIDLIAIVAMDGRVLHNAAFGLAAPVREQATALVAPGAALYEAIVRPLLDPATDKQRQENAILHLGGRPLLVVGQAILRSNGSGPAQGVLLMGSLFSEHDQRLVEAQTLVDFDLHEFDSAPLPAIPPAEEFRSANNAEGRIEVIGQHLLRLTVRFDTAQGGAFVVSSDYPRDISAAGRKALMIAAALAVACLAVLVLLLYRGLLLRAFIAPLSEAEAVLNRIENRHDFSVRIAERGAGELRQLARAFNRMMGELEAYRDEIAEQSMTDALTGLPNRRQFDQEMNREFARAQRQQDSMALLMIDVDQFKAFNDHYGHPAGDACLRRIADAIKESLLRGADTAARYGGEEFAALLPDTNLEGALTTAQRMLEAVRDLNIEHLHSGTGVSCVTISIGVCAGVPAPILTVDNWLQRADRALYAAKHQGRNRCAHRAEPVETPNE